MRWAILRSDSKRHLALLRPAPAIGRRETPTGFVIVYITFDSIACECGPKVLVEGVHQSCQHAPLDCPRTSRPFLGGKVAPPAPLLPRDPPVAHGSLKLRSNQAHRGGGCRTHAPGYVPGSLDTLE